MAAEEVTFKEKLTESVAPLLLHVELKMIQSMSLLGLAGSSLWIGLRNREVPFSQKVPKIGRVVQNAGVFGMFLAAVMVGFKMVGWTKEEVSDRSYRVMHNEPQLQLDRFSIVGAGFGSFVLRVAVEGTTRGAFVGAAGGTAAWLVYRLATWKDPVDKVDKIEERE